VEIKTVTHEFVDARFTVDELVILNNAINESLNGIEGWEYHTRLGATQTEAQLLLTKIAQAIEATQQL